MSREPNGPGKDEPEALSPLDPGVEAELLDALRAAWRPAPLDPARHRQILEAALEDPFAEPSDDEVRESARLRRALEEDDGSHPDVELARALRTAARPGAAKAAAVAVPRGPRAAGRVVFATFGAVALAAAAGFALFIASPRGEPAAESTTTAALHASRTTSELFDERFKTGGATERIDRIALARAHDLRENRYLAWGVR